MRSIAALLVLLAAAWPAAALAGPTAGIVMTERGTCFVEAASRRSPIRAGDAVHVGDVVVVPPGAKLKLRMIDGSIVSAAAGSRVTIERYAVAPGGRDVELGLAAGLLRAVVAKLAAPSHFEIDTATGAAAVRSTDWFIEAKPGATRVGVLRGVVALTSRATGRHVDIGPHEGASVAAGEDPGTPRRWRDAEFAAVIARTRLD